MPVTFIRKAEDDPVLQAAARMEGKLRQAFVDAVAAMRGTVRMDKLTSALARGDINQVMAVLAIDENFTAALQGKGLEANIMSLRDALQQTYAAGAKAAMQKLPSKISIDLSFDLLNPEAVKFLQNYSFNLIRQITDETRESIRNVVVRAFREGGHPFEQAREMRDSIGLTANQEAAVASYRNSLMSTDRMQETLQRSLRDGRFDRSVMSAVNNQRPLEQAQIDKMVARYRERFIDYRAKMIARTETIRASMAGQRELWRQAKDQNLFDEKHTRRVWIASGDANTCPECAELDGTSVALDEEFVGGDPPLHPLCRCSQGLEFGEAA